MNRFGDVQQRLVESRREHDDALAQHTELRERSKQEAPEFASLIEDAGQIVMRRVIGPRVGMRSRERIHAMIAREGHSVLLEDVLDVLFPADPQDESMTP